MNQHSRPGLRCLASSLCLVTAFSAGAGVARAQDRPTSAQHVTAGAAVFGEKGCAACHFLSGEEGASAPDLRMAAGARTFHDFAAALWNHLPAMSERMEELGIDRPRLSPQELGDLIAFLYSLDYFEPPGDAVRGRAVFEDKSCIGCHRVGGVGGVVGPDLDYLGDLGVPIEAATAMWNHGPAMDAAIEARNVARPTLSGADLADLMAFLEDASRRAVGENVHVLPGSVERGRRLVDDRGCSSCHGQAGAADGSAPDLAGLERRYSVAGFGAAMWNKGPAMRAAASRAGVEVPRLTATEVADIVAYLYSVDYFAGPGDAGRGRSTIGTAGCLDCHSLDGAGAGTAGDLGDVRGLDRAAPVIAALWNHTLVGLRAPGVPPDAWPALTGTQMADLIAFFETGSQ